METTRSRISATDALEDFRSQKIFAVVGATPKKEKFGHWVFESLRRGQQLVVPVNPHYHSVDGIKCYASLSDLPVRPGVVFIVVDPLQAMAVLQDCLETGVRRVFFQQGAESKQAIEFCDAHGITALYGSCAIQYFAPHGYHRLHTWLGNLLFLKPKLNSP